VENNYMSMRGEKKARIELAVKKAVIYDGLQSYSEWHEDPSDISEPESFYFKLYAELVKAEQLIGEHLDEAMSLPEKSFEILFRQSEYAEILKNESKFPRGYCGIHSKNSYFTFLVWPELYKTILSSIRLANNSKLAITVEIPFLEKYPDTTLPILGYSFVSVIEK
jgi:hypothetical protein